MMQLRRDTALATSKQLSSASKGMLRSSPLASDKLFAGRIPQVLEFNRSEQERAALHRQWLTKQRGSQSQRPVELFKPAKPEGVTSSKKKSHKKKGKSGGGPGNRPNPPPPAQPFRGRGS